MLSLLITLTSPCWPQEAERVADEERRERRKRERAAEETLQKAAAEVRYNRAVRLPRCSACEIQACARGGCDYEERYKERTLLMPPLHGKTSHRKHRWWS